MAPSETTLYQGSADISASRANTKSIISEDTSDGLARKDRSEEQNGERPQNGTTENKSNEEGKGEVLSNAEKKKRAKEEKIAKRAKEKAKQSGGPVEARGAQKPEVQGEQSRGASIVPGPPTPNTKIQQGHHKRTGSGAKSIPLKALQAQTSLPMMPPKQSSKLEAKKVALFGHLYGQPRRTTIATASKDVHSAVLALGLQTSNYVICGSSARCVAMLLVFKRVSSTL